MMAFIENYEINVPVLPSRKIKPVEIVPFLLGAMFKAQNSSISRFNDDITREIGQINHIEYRGIDTKNCITSHVNGNPFDGETEAYTLFFEKRKKWDYFVQKYKRFFGLSFAKLIFVFSEKDYKRLRISKLNGFPQNIIFTYQ